MTTGVASERTAPELLSMERNGVKVADIVIWPDGTATLRWSVLDKPHSTENWDSFMSLAAVHCDSQHPGAVFRFR